MGHQEHDPKNPPVQPTPSLPPVPDRREPVRRGLERVVARARHRRRRRAARIRRAPTSDGAREHRGKRSARDEELCDACLQRVRENDRRDGRAGRDRRGEPVEAHERVAGGVQRSRRTSAWSSRRVPLEWRRRQRLGFRDGGDDDHGQPSLARADRHLDRDGGAAAGAEHEEGVGRPERRSPARICAARPSVRSMNIAWRCPFGPTTWVWKVIESSTSGLKPG